MKIFALDTSTPRVVACYSDDEKKIFVELETKAKHGIQISNVADMMKDVDFTTLDVVGIGIGPGSLTGLRVGVSFAVGLGIGKKFVQVNSLNLIAHNLQFFNGYVIVLRKAREGYLYGAVYKNVDCKMEEIEKPFIDDVKSIEKKIEMYNPKLCVGDGSELFSCSLNENNFNLPSARNLLRLVEEEIKRENFSEFVEPLYLQKSIAELNFERKQKESKQL